MKYRGYIKYLLKSLRNISFCYSLSVRFYYDLRLHKQRFCPKPPAFGMCPWGTCLLLSWLFALTHFVLLFITFLSNSSCSSHHLSALCISHKVLWVSKSTHGHTSAFSSYPPSQFCLFLTSFLSPLQIALLLFLLKSSGLQPRWAVILFWSDIHREAKNSMNLSKAQTFPIPLKASLYPDLLCSFWLNLPISIWCHTTL